MIEKGGKKEPKRNIEKSGKFPEPKGDKGIGPSGGGTIGERKVISAPTKGGEISIRRQ